MWRKVTTLGLVVDFLAHIELSIKMAMYIIQILTSVKKVSMIVMVVAHAMIHRVITFANVNLD